MGFSIGALCEWLFERPLWKIFSASGIAMMLLVHCEVRAVQINTFKKTWPAAQQFTF